jgi:DNA polymerase elongation subunit (family B)
MVTKTYTRANGYPADCEIIYGDTDSVMVDFRVPDTAAAMDLGRVMTRILRPRIIMKALRRAPVCLSRLLC